MKYYLDDLYAVKDIINNKQVLLSATDTTWSLVCDAMSEKAYAAMQKIKNPINPSDHELMVNSISQLKKYIHDIHPRIETLLLYHEKPLSVYYRPAHFFPGHLKSSAGKLAFRITKDPMLSELIDLLDRPLLTVPAVSKANLIPCSYEDIDEDIIDKCKYIFQTGRHLQQSMQAPVLVSFNQQGDLIFHRE